MISSSPTIDLTRMYRQCVFRSKSAVDSHDHLRHALAEHVLRWRGGQVDSALYSAGARQLQMFILSYGPEVEVRPQPFDGFALVQMPLRGTVEIESDGDRICVGPGQVAIIAPCRNIRLLWSRDCEQLILRLPHQLVREAAARSSMPKFAGTAECMFAPAFVLDSHASAQWNGLMQSLVNLALPDDMSWTSNCHPAWLDHVERSLALFLLTQQDSTLATANTTLTNTTPSLQATDNVSVLNRASLEPRLAAVERYMRTRLYAPLGLADLANAAGVSPRTLHMLCKRNLGATPMNWLRNLRLDAANEKLKTDATSQISDVAMEFGLSHLGRFSANYRERFGELPRDTVATRQGAANHSLLTRATTSAFKVFK